MANKIIFIILFIFFSTSYSQVTGDIIITELSPKGEWFEVINNSEGEIDLFGWKICDNRSEDSLVDEHIVIKSKEIILFAENLEELNVGGITAYKLPSKITLNNDGDTLDIYSPNLILSDRAGYNEKMVNSNVEISLIRVDISNFAMAENSWLDSYATPGYINNKISTTKTSVTTGPILFTPNNDGVDDYYKIKIMSGIIFGSKIEIYSFSGEKLFEIGMPINGEYFWDGICSGGAKFPTGPFFTVVRFENGDAIKKEAILWR